MCLSYLLFLYLKSSQKTDVSSIKTAIIRRENHLLIKWHVFLNTSLVHPSLQFLVCFVTKKSTAEAIFMLNSFLIEKRNTYPLLNIIINCLKDNFCQITACTAVVNVNQFFTCVNFCFIVDEK